MPGKIKVKILAGRNLPVMDRSSDTTDAYVELKFGNTTYKTDVCRKSLNPLWNSEWYRFEVDDAELQDEPLQIRLMDHDTYSANDAIGKVYINLNPLLLPGVPPPVKNMWTLEASMNSTTGSQGGSVMTGWIPVYDTMHGIRGEVNIIVKVELFSDFNKFRQSSCGVKFFYSPNIPYGYHAQVIHGFVEELVVSDDPEYKWIDKIRTPRASNEARQTLFFKLSGEVQRKIGLKALDLGGNAVIGYLQNFDLEGESGIVARGIGTAITLVKLHDVVSLPADTTMVEEFALGLHSQSKTQFDHVEADDSLPLLSHSPNQAAYSPTTNFQTTHVSNKFPGYGKPIPKRSTTILKVSQYEPIPLSEKNKYHYRQMSLESNKLKISGGSSLSLSDAVIEEASVRTMLALEDMRGEPTSRFSRGLRNLRQLPQSVLSLKAGPVKPKMADSYDEESDLDSTYSSSWSVGGSDSTRSSVANIGQIKRKKFTHKKSSGEGMASLLIRSIHSSVPLDSVREDRETPTPSPVKFLSDAAEGSDSKIDKQDTDDCSSSNEEYFSKEKLVKYCPNAIQIMESKEELNKLKDDSTIPMISSSETDTSTSDDEPSESSANYYILDDSEVFVDPGSPTVEKMISKYQDSNVTISPTSSLVRPVHKKLVKIKENHQSLHKKRPIVTDKGSSTDQTSSDMDTDALNREKNSSMISELNSVMDLAKSTSEISCEKPEDEDKRNEVEKQSQEVSLETTSNISEIDIAISSPECLLGEMKFVMEEKCTGEFEKNAPVAVSTPVESNSDSSFEEAIPSSKPNTLAEIETKLSDFDKKIPISTCFIDKEESSDEEIPIIIEELTEETTDNCIKQEQKEKDCKKVQRSDTVIYKGPIKEREKPLVVQRADNNLMASTQSLPVLPPIPIIINPPEETSKCSSDELSPEFTDSSEKNTDYPENMKALIHKTSTSLDSFDNLAQENVHRRLRQHSMLELIRIIDTKMMVHPHHGRTDSTRSRRRKHDRGNRQLTPSLELANRSHVHSGKSMCKSSDRNLHVHSKTLHVERASPGPENLLKNQSPSVPCEHHPHSCHSSRESLHKHDNELVPPVSAANLRPSFSKESVPVTVSATCQKSTTHETAVQKLAADLQNRNVLSVGADIELTALKSASANPSALLSPQKPSGSIYKSCSACNLRKMSDDNECTKTTNAANITDNLCVPCPCPDLRQQEETSLSPSCPLGSVPSSAGNKISHSPATKIHSHIPLHRRSSDSDLSITPKGNSLAGSDRSVGGFFKTSTAVVRTMNQDALEMLEYPFITMQQYPPGFLVHIGGLVSSRSVKLLERISNLEEPESRDAWWTEIRMEVRSHARALACNVVVGYKEETSICDDVCVLNASGTAALINLHNAGQDQDGVFLSRLQPTAMSASTDSDREKAQQKSTVKTEKNDTDVPASGQQTQQTVKVKRTSESNDHEMPYSQTQSGCHLCHLPYGESSVPFRVNISKCAICRKAKVPDVMFTTIELPENIPMTGRGCFIQATVCKSKRDLKGEHSAKEISDCLPFLEYELHSLLLNKLKVKGMNAIFGLRVQVSVGERFVIGMGVGTAVFLTALPAPSVPHIASGNSWHNEEQLSDLQKALVEAVKKNREFYRLKPVGEIENGRIPSSDTDESDEDLPDMDLSLGTRDTCVLEVDDIEDLDRISLLMDEKAPDDFHVVNTQSIPGLEDLEIVRNLQMFTQVSRAKIPAGQSASMPSKYLARLLQTVYFKLRRMVPCALCDMQFKVALPEQDEIQIFVVGMALGLGEPIKHSKSKKKAVTHSVSKDQVKKTDDNDMIFSLDEDHVETNISEKTTNTSVSERGALSNSIIQKSRPRSPLWPKRHTTYRHKHVPLKERYGVDITPLSYLPGGRIERYLGNLNFFFIRESTCIRENGGLSGFTHSFVMEVLAIVRAHITALGGNAMVAFFMTQCVLLHSPHKNQGQCLINVGGDVVSVSYFANEKHSGLLNC